MRLYQVLCLVVSLKRSCIFGVTLAIIFGYLYLITTTVMVCNCLNEYLCGVDNNIACHVKCSACLPVVFLKSLAIAGCQVVP